MEKMSRKRKESWDVGGKNSFLLTIKLFPETFKSIINGKMSREREESKDGEKKPVSSNYWTFSQTYKPMIGGNEQRRKRARRWWENFSQTND